MVDQLFIRLLGLQRLLHSRLDGRLSRGGLRNRNLDTTELLGWWLRRLTFDLGRPGFIIRVWGSQGPMNSRRGLVSLPRARRGRWWRRPLLSSSTFHVRFRNNSLPFGLGVFLADKVILDLRDPVSVKSHWAMHVAGTLTMTAVFVCI